MAQDNGNMKLLEQTIAAVLPASEGMLAVAEEKQLELTKPPGSLGVLEELGNRLAAMAGQCPPPLPTPAVVGVFAGDHGVVAENVTPWPQEVTGQMLANIASGGAAINVLTSQVGASIVLTDVGVASKAIAHPRIRNRRVRSGTRDMSVEPAMTNAEAVEALEVGITTALEAIEGGARLLATGEMGIGNTTPSSALIAVLTGEPASKVTGSGAGAHGEMLQHKTDVIAQAIVKHAVNREDPLGALAAVGGLEHAALAGFILGGASRRIPVVLDGVIACSAALVAAALAPSARDYLISGHVGAEPGIAVALGSLGLRPLVDLGLRLGEGTGAALAIPTVQGAARLLGEMATFSDLANPRMGWTAIVLGGARSGKSTWAEERFQDQETVDYVATSAANDDDAEWQRRIDVHRARRPSTWRTIETTDLAAVLQAGETAPVIIDCLAVWLTRVLDEVGAWQERAGWREALGDRTDALIEAISGTTRQVVLVSNEVGQGVVPDSAAGRLFRDELGQLNAHVVKACHEAWWCEAGVARRIA